MRKKETNTNKKVIQTRPPEMSPEARESRMVALAIDLAEEQLRNGTASSQVITHYLKLGSTMEQEKKDIMREQKKLLEAKTEAIRSSKRIEELYSQALSVMRKYNGDDDE